MDPHFVVGSPPCADFSLLTRNFCHPRMEPARVRRRLHAALVHLRFCCDIYKDQLRRGRHFVHEHPAGAASWVEEAVNEIMQMPGVDTVVMHQCQYGLR